MESNGVISTSIQVHLNHEDYHPTLHLSFNLPCTMIVHHLEDVILARKYVLNGGVMSACTVLLLYVINPISF
jgi:hypothetical protein